MTVDLSPFGVKVRAPQGVDPAAGTAVQLELPLPDGDRPVSLPADVVRADSDGIALDFSRLGAEAFDRIKKVVDSLGMSGGGTRDRRRALRVPVALDVNFDAEKPASWAAKTIDLSPFGVKVAMPTSVGQPAWGTGVNIRLAVPGGQPPFQVKGVVWRREPTSVTLLFVDLNRGQLRRLEALIESLSAQLAS